MRGIEEQYIHNLDRQPPPANKPERGFEAESFAIGFLNQMGLETRFSTWSEDQGRRGEADIGPKQIIDGVSYIDHRPVMAPQITINTSKQMREKKLQEMRDKPFVRLPEMTAKDLSIPRVTIAFDPKSNEAPLQIIDSCIVSLTYDLNRTKNPLEQKAVRELIELFKEQKKKYIH